MKFSVLLILSFLFISCNHKKQDNKLQHSHGEIFGTTFSIIYDADIKLDREFDEVFEQINHSMSTYRENSDISRINRGDSTVVVDSLFIHVYESSRKIWKKTNGVFDPTVGPLVNAYGFGPDVQMPALDSVKIDSLRMLVGLDKVKLTDDNRIIKNDPRISLDFNAIAKGYALDLIAQTLDKNNLTDYLIEIGGELLVKGQNTSKNKNWTVAIDDPTQDITERSLIRILELKDQAMATSGNYRKFLEDPVTGQKYVHSINPVTGWPKISNVLSTSVIAESCMEADAYATVFMVMDLEETQNFIKENPELEALIIYTDEMGILQEWMTPGFEKIIIE